MKKILIIDDDKDLQQAYAEALTTAQFQPVAALSGEDGLKMAQESPPDLVILDIYMPGMPGTDVLKELKKNPKTKQIPVIMLTNIDNQVVPSYQQGAIWYFLKVSTPLSEVINKIKELLHVDIGEPTT